MLESAKKYFAFVWSSFIETGNVEKVPLTFLNIISIYKGMLLHYLAKYPPWEVAYYYQGVLS